MRSARSSWSGLRNLLRRSWLKVPWNVHSANAAVACLIEAGNLRAAADAVEHMGETGMRLRPEALHSLLRLACKRTRRRCAFRRTAT